MALQEVMRVDNGKMIRGGGTSNYADLTSKPQVNGVELSGNKTASQLGMANSNTFQGTIAEWNALSTAEKKAYDHASLTGAGGGEYNVDKTTGGLDPTAGMPDTYPAEQVMMSDGVTSVEDAVDALVNRGSVSVTADGVKTIATLLNELYALIDESKLTPLSYIYHANSYWRFSVRLPDNLFFERGFSITGNQIYYDCLCISNNSVINSWELTLTGNVYTNNSAVVPQSGQQILLFY